MNNWKVYKYIAPNQKVYIGQTKETLDRRARKNGEGYKFCSHFYAAIQKYGFSNFKREITFRKIIWVLIFCL